MEGTRFTDLGEQIFDLTLYGGAFGIDERGRDVVYTVVTGKPAKLVMMDLGTRSLRKEIPLPGSNGAWAIGIAPDGQVWIGSYRNGHIYSYHPKTDRLQDWGRSPANQDMIYGFAIDLQGTVYGGTYGAAEVFRYTADGQPSSLGSVFPDKYTRDLAIDPTGTQLFAGVGARKANVVQINLRTKQKKYLLPSIYQKESMAYQVDYINGLLFIKLTPSHTAILLDPNTKSVISLTEGTTGQSTDSFPMGSQGVSPLSPDQETVYYTYAGRLYQFSLSTKTFSPVRANGDIIDLSGNVIAWGWIHGGRTLTGLVGNYQGQVFTYQPDTEEWELFTLPFPPQPMDICHITASPTGKIYCNAFINGTVSEFDTKTQQRRQYSKLGQVEGWCWYQEALYAGTYPEAKIYRYDVAKPWIQPQNPSALFNLKKKHKQSRPRALYADQHQIYVGTVPDYGMLGGTLAIYPLHGRQEPIVYNQLIPDQSIVSLTKMGNQLWGGSSIEGGQGSTPRAKKAVLFCFDLDKEEIRQFHPLSSARIYRVGALLPTPDQSQLWGIADGQLFLFDLQAEQVRFLHRLVDKGTATGSALTYHPNGLLYAVTDGRLFQIDPNNQYKITHIPYQEGLYWLALYQKDLYLKAGSSVPEGTKLIRYTP